MEIIDKMDVVSCNPNAVTDEWGWRTDGYMYILHTSCWTSISGGVDKPECNECVLRWYLSRSFAVCFSNRATSVLKQKIINSIICCSVSNFFVKKKNYPISLVTYSSFVRLAANISFDIFTLETKLLDLNANILPENVATSSSGSSVPMHPPTTEVTGSPENCNKYPFVGSVIKIKYYYKKKIYLRKYT